MGGKLVGLWFGYVVLLVDEHGCGGGNNECVGRWVKVVQLCK